MALAVPTAQLLPLPPSIWTRLPGRTSVVTAFEQIGRDLPWAPLSMSPSATWLSALSLIPPLAIFLCTMLLNYRERRLLSLVALGAGLADALLGLIQIAQGPSSALRFFEYTNASDAVGFFANRNHFAALLYCLLLLVAAWIAAASAPLKIGRNKKRLETSSIVSLLACFAVLVVLMSAQVMTRSRAGLILTIAALFGAVALPLGGQRGVTSVTQGRLILGATSLVVVLSLQFAAYRLLERFSGDPLADARVVFVRNTVEAARTFMPFGAGLGTFQSIYAMFEKPSDMMSGTYTNHAHNDFLELWLETGIAGPALIGVFVWFVFKSAGIKRSNDTDALLIDRSLARAAALIICLLCAHSLVDYPLRTGAMMAVVAFSCALLIERPKCLSDGGEGGVELTKVRKKRTSRPRISDGAILRRW